MRARLVASGAIAAVSVCALVACGRTVVGSKQRTGDTHSSGGAGGDAPASGGADAVGGSAAQGGGAAQGSSAAGGLDGGPSPNGSGGIGGPDGAPPTQPQEASCLQLDRQHAAVFAPAGVRLEFRALDCNGNPTRPLMDGDVVVSNDVTGEPFGSTEKSGSISQVSGQAGVDRFTVLALDVSDSMGEANAEGTSRRDRMIDAAKVLVDELMRKPAAPLKHAVEVRIFGDTTQQILSRSFVREPDLVDATLEYIRTSPTRGNTDMYRGYRYAMQTEAETLLNVADQFVVFITDGTDELGDDETRRQLALNAKAGSPALAYVVGLQIDDPVDPCTLEELAEGGEITSACRQESACTDEPTPAACQRFFSDVPDAELNDTVVNIAAHIQATTQSRYAINICTPETTGTPSATITASVDGLMGSTSIPYEPEGKLSGDLGSCDPNNPENARLICDNQGNCALACATVECGPDPVFDIECGPCGSGRCSVAQTCGTPCAGMRCGYDAQFDTTCGTCIGGTTCSSEFVCR